VGLAASLQTRADKEAYLNTEPIKGGASILSGKWGTPFAFAVSFGLDF